MIQDQAFLEILDFFDTRNIEYMISGSVASMFYGKPRMTHDIDLVIDISLKSAIELYEKVKERYYISEEGIRDAVAHETTFNLIHNETGFKIDCWILTESEFDVSRFKRRQKHKIDGKELYFSSPEDTVIIKLVWFKESGYRKHMEDVSDMLRLFPGNLDLEYMRNWIGRLGLQHEAGVANLSIE